MARKRSQPAPPRKVKRASNKEARDLFAAASSVPADEVLATFESEAQQCLARMEAGLKKGEKANIIRFSLDRLKWCANFLREPPPPALVRLIETLLAVGEPSVGTGSKSSKYKEVVDYIAEHPNAGESEVRRELHYQQHAMIQEWFASPKFKADVERARSRLQQARRNTNFIIRMIAGYNAKNPDATKTDLAGRFNLTPEQADELIDSSAFEAELASLRAEK